MRRPRFCGVACRFLVLAFLLLAAAGAAVAFASYFASMHVAGLLNFTRPPLLLYWLPGLDEEVSAAQVGANFTSFGASVAASLSPDAVCNPFLNLTVSVYTSSGTLILPLCWLPASGREYIDYTNNVLYASTVAVWSSYGSHEPGSILVYNESVFTVPPDWSLVFIGGGFQSIYYPGLVGGWSGGNDTVSLCINVSVAAGGIIDELITDMYVYIYVGYFRFNGTALTYLDNLLVRVYSGTLLGWRSYNDTWLCGSFSYNPNDLSGVDASTPGVYVVALAPVVVLYNTGGVFGLTSATLGPVYMSLDDVFHNVSLSGKGFYLTAPVVQASPSLLSGQWLLWPGGEEAQGLQARNYTLLSFLGLPVPTEPPWSLANVTGGLGVLAVYGYMGSSGTASLSFNLSYGDGAVEARYPVSLQAFDPHHGRRGRGFEVLVKESMTPVERLVSQRATRLLLGGAEAELRLLRGALGPALLGGQASGGRQHG